LRSGLRKKNGKTCIYRGRIEVITIQHRAGVYLHMALIKPLTDANDNQLSDHVWASFPFDLYTKFRRGDWIEFHAVSEQYKRKDGTCDYGLDCNGVVSKVGKVAPVKEGS
jgi:hypothetical protein